MVSQNLQSSFIETARRTGTPTWLQLFLRFDTRTYGGWWGVFGPKRNRLTIVLLYSKACWHSNHQSFLCVPIHKPSRWEHLWHSGQWVCTNYRQKKQYLCPLHAMSETPLNLQMNSEISNKDTCTDRILQYVKKTKTYRNTRFQCVRHQTDDCRRPWCNPRRDLPTDFRKITEPRLCLIRASKVLLS